MTNPTIDKELLEEVHLLPMARQRQVVEFARLLRNGAVHGVPMLDLAKFAGSIPQVDLDAISKAIEEGCERVDDGEW